MELTHSLNLPTTAIQYEYNEFADVDDDLLTYFPILQSAAMELTFFLIVKLHLKTLKQIYLFASRTN